MRLGNMRSGQSPSAGTMLSANGSTPSLRTAGIAGLGMAVPEKVVTNEPIARRLGVADGWIETRTGIRERRHAAPDATLAALAAEAAGDALAVAKIEAADLDLVLVATTSQDKLLPNAAPLVAAELGAGHVGAIDIGAACTGFVSGLALAAGQIESGRAQNVLVVGAEIMSRLVDPDDRPTAGLFGDGAGAAVVTAGGAAQLGPAVQRSDGVDGPDLIYATKQERVVHMAGQDTFRHAVRRLSESTVEAVDAADLTLDQIDVFVYHQANGRILRAVGERLSLPSERVVDCIGRYANTSAATIPIALVEADRAGMLVPGARVLLSAFGAGFTWGAMTIEWGAEDA
ncbi:MAG: 3-oxoacyl-[acyl-carrier-protein] synthase, KASIII [uncultured Thermomicrobiales bacterium]|uniref:Beta-ketoacyl-[acyl-carrier-protein] synthase III n=1 Tax=uncultured Thermomicrobiales bacterium TaxID=1645740 RepID=A0A6J4VS41_9BACT|nr:MAG: 3-oxoacyl-[acyl-carrier-protein] synthase, KASIII [uncultured Thermomicrobiales bacterium]